MKITITDIRFDERGLVPAIVQDANTLQVLTLAYMNAESLKSTLETNETWFWSRSRSSLWHKGETSGNKQRVVDVTMDCDYDAIRILVVPEGPACHTGALSCFHNELQDAPASNTQKARAQLGAILGNLYELIESRKRERPDGSYTTYLFAEGLDKILKKVGEESTETIIAAKNEDSDALIREASDLLYHLIVLLVERGLTLDQVSGELSSRRKKGK
ncbi:MAG TPA: bifunctional phosphoribosyl-AMP cyclohydrolase/phosphoribosyl-ATP diphosphatase HisIE [Pyrinomonadaceae bacterium]|nr:bifunctional phosphoribosyl-AMP cyclohydrolase/phosphoribosyl-ATP diphosphatase HisIE [Pyrinomonadaceae bacterium]